MARQRVNPSAVRAQAQPPAESTLPTGMVAVGRHVWAVMAANVLTVALLTLSFAPYDAWYLAYVALVPWLIAQKFVPQAHAQLWQWARTLWPTHKFLAAVRLAVAALLRLVTSPGLLFWAINVYWLSWITPEGYTGLVLYLWLYWLAAGLAIRWAIRRDLPLWLCLPLVWVSLEWARSYIISGFPWFYLGHTQYQRTVLIQIADATGAYGVSFALAMANGLLADIALGKMKSAKAPADPALAPEANIAWKRRIAIGIGTCSAVFVLIIVYGLFRLTQHTTRPGPAIGVVQEKFPIALGVEGDPPQKVFDKHLQASRLFIGAGCDVMIWPETMLPTYINAEALDLDIDKLTPTDLRSLAYKISPTDDWWDPAIWSDAGLRRTLQFSQYSPFRDAHEYANEIANLTQQLQCPLLAGGQALHRNPEPINDHDRWMTWNSALWFDRSDHNLAEYAKVHLVPFSEYVPFRKSCLPLHKLLRSFVPAVMQQLEPGPGYSSFTLDRNGNQWKIVAPVCYEGTFDRLCRQMVVKDGKKVADIIANISNDGWFGWKWFPGRPSNENAEHLAQYYFRAVENRVPVVRAVNTGISASIDSNGRLRAIISRGDKQAMITGTLLLKDGAKPLPDFIVGPQVLVDSRITLYSLVGDVFPAMVLAAAIGGFAWITMKRRKHSQGDSR